MLTLGIETSCDETAAAVVENGKKMFSSCVSSSIHLHQKFGGIVPEIASRYHLEYIIPVVESALQKAQVKLKDINLVTVTHTPGLVGSLLVGVSFAKALSLALNKPLLGVNHIQAHLFSPFLEQGRFHFPFVGLVVSGGHTSLAYVKDFDKIKIIGKTRDDAAGEAFDKVAKMLGLTYPGGPIIDKLASTINQSPFRFKCATLNNSLDFSFSGIKTDVLYAWAKVKNKNKKAKAQICYSFQKQVVNVLVDKSIQACNKHKTQILSVGGGVACNNELRNKLISRGKENNIKIFLSGKHLCLDNAAMIAALGYHLYKKGVKSKYTLTALATPKQKNHYA
ncbi:MAG: tRNA (adenosine(37)-N6)-threonylcarbamoyltransferase complex transferase subunit TsaD [Candidatus Omnitrophota bacterium]